MAKSLEQVVAEGLIADCGSQEELFVLWQTVHHMETDTLMETCCKEIDPRSFHIDGVINPQKFSGVLYLLKEPNLKSYIEKGLTFPVITDIRREFYKYKKGFKDECGYLVGMQRILLGEAGKEMSSRQVVDTFGVLYLNKRGGCGEVDNVWLRYGYAYVEFIKRQIHLIQPRVIICVGEEIFHFVVDEVFSRKKTLRNRVEQWIWKGMNNEYLFTADSSYHYTTRPDRAAVIAVNMWNPMEMRTGGENPSPEAYLSEFERRVYGMEPA